MSNNKKRPILVIDSGIGGLSILNNLVKQMPNEDYVYFADFKNLPYGNWNIAELKHHFITLVSSLCKTYNPKCCVIACNTATTIAINNLRTILHNCIVVGTEPAIKPAMLECKNILLMATNITEKYNRLVNIHKKFCSNISYAKVSKLAELIENNINNLDEINSYLNKQLSRYKNKVDGVVLGCTHYSFVKKQIINILGDNIKIFDSCKGVANRVYQSLTYFKLQNNTGGKIDFVCEENNDTQKLKNAWNIIKGVS